MVNYGILKYFITCLFHLLPVCASQKPVKLIQVLGLLVTNDFSIEVK
jgi:hypothetical protein